MRRLGKPLILCVCVAFFTLLSATMLRGQVPAKKRQATDKMKAIPAQVVAVIDAPPMGRPKPGSADAERMAAFVAQCNAGLVPLVRVGLPPKEDHSKGPRMPDFAPTEIVPQPKVSGEMLAFQQKLSPAFAASDPIPPSRIHHFAWLKGHPNVRIFGWYGTVTGAQVQEDSSVIVAIEFHAMTDITGQRALVRDYVTERYLVANGRLQLIDTDAAISNPSIQVITAF